MSQPDAVPGLSLCSHRLSDCQAEFIQYGFRELATHWKNMKVSQLAMPLSPLRGGTRSQKAVQNQGH